MNIYFLVEGRSTEKKLYPKWLKYYLPQLKKVQFHDQIKINNYYLISGNGYPSIIDHGIPNAVQKIQETGKYDYFVICLDADEDTVSERKEYINDFILSKNIELGKTKLILILQNRCIETWLLGNRKIFNSKQPQESPLSDYVQYYDVSQNNPEIMGKYVLKNHANFHEAYLKEIFRAKNLSYTKKHPGETQEKYYFEELLKRIEEQSNHLQTFKTFIEFCDKIKANLS
ncbi:MAG: hypothetical protein QNJ64_04455 [Crocosphaera sp.]|nr:hypothetical protein [Crocosphaera sp.]